jgi:hypothetical protein
MTTKTGKDIVNYDALLAGMAQDAATMERPSGSTIGTRSGVLSYNGSPVPGNTLNVIVIASVFSNTLYEGKFDPNNLSSPVCFAYSENGENMAPHPASSKPQNTDCDTCPNNKWGSDPDGGRGKACKNGRSLAVIPADTSVEAIPTAEIAILRPPVTSIKNWQMYVQKVSSLYNRPPLAMITEVSTQPDVKTQFKVCFNDVKPVDISMIPGLLDRVPAALDICQKIYEDTGEAVPRQQQPEQEGRKF